MYKQSQGSPVFQVDMQRGAFSLISFGHGLNITTPFLGECTLSVYSLCGRFFESKIETNTGLGIEINCPTFNLKSAVAS